MSVKNLRCHENFRDENISAPILGRFNGNLFVESMGKKIRVTYIAGSVDEANVYLQDHPDESVLQSVSLSKQDDFIMIARTKEA